MMNPIILQHFKKGLQVLSQQPSLGDWEEVSWSSQQESVVFSTSIKASASFGSANTLKIKKHNKSAENFTVKFSYKVNAGQVAYDFLR